MIQEPEFADQFTGLGLSRLRPGELGFGRDQRGQGRLNAGLEGGRTPERARRARLEYLLRRALGLPSRLRGGQAGLGVTHVARQG